MSASALDVERPVSSLGFDSLMAIELKNRVEADLGIVMPIVQFLQGPSVAQLTALLLHELEAPAADAPPSSGVNSGVRRHGDGEALRVESATPPTDETWEKRRDMTGTEILAALSEQNIEVWVEGERLRFRAPAGALTPALRAMLTKKKEEVLHLLRRQGCTSRAYPLSYSQRAMWFLIRRGRRASR